jgi:hypothetical protein
MQLQATQAANQAKSAVQQNSTALQQKLSERQKLLGQLDQAKMQEQLNSAMASLSESVGQDVPTFDEVRDKIEARYAKAKGLTELQGRRWRTGCSRSSSDGQPRRAASTRCGWSWLASALAAGGGRTAELPAAPDGSCDSCAATIRRLTAAATVAPQSAPWPSEHLTVRAK